MFEFDQLVVLQMNFSSMPHDILDAKTPSKKKKNSYPIHRNIWQTL